MDIFGYLVIRTFVRHTLHTRTHIRHNNTRLRVKPCVGGRATHIHDSHTLALPCLERRVPSIALMAP